MTVNATIPQLHGHYSTETLVNEKSKTEWSPVLKVRYTHIRLNLQHKVHCKAQDKAFRLKIVCCDICPKDLACSVFCRCRCYHQHTHPHSSNLLPRTFYSQQSAKVGRKCQILEAKKLWKVTIESKFPEDSERSQSLTASVQLKSSHFLFWPWLNE